MRRLTGLLSSLHRYYDPNIMNPKFVHIQSVYRCARDCLELFYAIIVVHVQISFAVNLNCYVMIYTLAE